MNCDECGAEIDLSGTRITPITPHSSMGVVACPDCGKFYLIHDIFDAISKNKDALTGAGGRRSGFSREDILASSFTPAEGERSGYWEGFIKEIRKLADQPPSGPSKVFVSYSRNDAGDFAERIHDYLKHSGYDVFTDVYTPPPLGDDWTTVIEEKISKCDFFVLVITNGALRSTEVNNEVLQALREKKKVIPCIHKDVRKNDIKWGLGHPQGINFEDKFELARKLCKIPSLVKN